ncbi:RNA-binding protein 8A [Thoreauomyces humboldtii]|nr:RNA-binding protein 8A [Thoreauomyces humboldtii]
MAATDNFTVDLDDGVDEMAVDEVPSTDPIDNVKANATRKKGRGFQSQRGEDNDGSFANARFEALEEGPSAGQAQRSVEGWIILVTGVNEEATEEEVTERCADFGEIKNVHLNLDRRTGYVKGYALVEYETHKEALEAVAALNGSTFLEGPIAADFAFVRGASASRSVQERNKSGGPRRTNQGPQNGHDERHGR